MEWATTWTAPGSENLDSYHALLEELVTTFQIKDILERICIKHAADALWDIIHYNSQDRSDRRFHLVIATPREALHLVSVLRISVIVRAMRLVPGITSR